MSTKKGGRLANLTTRETEINYLTKEEIDTTVGTDPRDAIDNLDFETAERITNNSRLSNHKYLRDTSAQLIRDLDETDQQIRFERLRISQTIEREAQEASAMIKQEYQSKFARLVGQHRIEAENLKQRWIQHHKEAETVAMKKIDDLKHTSKVLASCECYDAAKDLRDRTQLNEDQITFNETSQVDRHFREQFETMLARHQEIYDALFREMNTKIKLVEDQVQLKKEKENIELSYRQSLSPVEMMKKISASADMSLAEKSSIIRTLTPSKLSSINSVASSQMRQSMLQELSDDN